MQIRLRCYNCRTPFAVKDDEIQAALNQLHHEGHKHYNALCPRCGRTNKVSKKQLKWAAPNWEPSKVPEKAKPKTKASPKTKTKTTTPKQAKPKAEVKAKAKTKSKVKAKAKTKAKTKTKTKAKAKTKKVSK